MSCLGRDSSRRSQSRTCPSSSQCWRRGWPILRKPSSTRSCTTTQCRTASMRQSLREMSSIKSVWRSLSRTSWISHPARCSITAHVSPRRSSPIRRTIGARMSLEAMSSSSAVWASQRCKTTSRACSRFRRSLLATHEAASATAVRTWTLFNSGRASNARALLLYSRVVVSHKTWPAVKELRPSHSSEQLVTKRPRRKINWLLICPLISTKRIAYHPVKDVK